MKDRISSHPGRVQLELVEDDIYDMTMADDPVELGTPLNKENLLSDATAAAINARFDSTPSTPNEALALLAGALGIETQTYNGDGTSGTGHENTLTFTHTPKLVFIFRDNYISSVNAVVLYWAAMSTSGIFVRVGDTSTTTRNEYTLSNNKKTITWKCDASDPAVGRQMQMNESGTYYVLSLY